MLDMGHLSRDKHVSQIETASLWGCFVIFRGFMNKKVYYCLPTYKSFDYAYEGVLAAMRSTLPPDQIVIIDNSGDGSGTAYLQPLAEKFNSVYIWPQTYNLGVARAWNLFHTTLPDDYILIANDDIQVEPHTIERIITTAEQNPDKILFSGDGHSGNAFSLFLLTKRGFNTIGAFDERFYPAYFEDNDYVRRMLLKGYSIVSVAGATYFHVVSSTLKKYTSQEMDAHHNAFRSNMAYYLQKWGGMPTEEQYETAFNI